MEISDGPYERNFTLSWVESSDGGGKISVSRPVDRYTIQVSGVGQGESYTAAVHVGNNVTSAVVVGLNPGREYEVWVVASNEAGGTPSEVILINTIATGEQAGLIESECHSLLRFTVCGDVFIFIL